MHIGARYDLAASSGDHLNGLRMRSAYMLLPASPIPLIQIEQSEQRRLIRDSVSRQFNANNATDATHLASIHTVET
jgi:hypothetical protein